MSVRDHNLRNKTGSVLIGIMLIGCHRADPVAELAGDVADMISAKDAKGLARLADEQDLRLVGLTEASFARLLTEEFFASWSPVSKPTLDDSNRSRGTVLVWCTLRNTSGQEMELSWSVSATDDGIKWLRPTTSIALFLAGAEIAATGIRPVGKNKVAGWRDFAATTGPQWEAKYGIKGFVPAREAGLFTWSQLVQRYDNLLAQNTE